MPKVSHNCNDQSSSAAAPQLMQTIALVGLMGAGKSTVGRRLANLLDVGFCDADDEIAIAAGRPIADIFAERGEEEFRAGERRVIARLLDEPPHILATGGGAFMNPLTRVVLRQKALTLWLRADLDTLMHRVQKRTDRPLLQNTDPRATMQTLITQRYPIYQEADFVVDSIDGPHNATVERIVKKLVDAKILDPKILRNLSKNGQNDVH